MTRVLPLTAAAALLSCLVLDRLHAQAPEPALAFEVASVRPSSSDAREMPRLDVRPRGQVTIRAYPLAWILVYAYGLQINGQVQGAPAWVHADRFDIRAVPPPDTPADGIPLLLRALLEDRFRLRARLETRDAPIYALVRQRGDGTLGPLIRPSQHDCAAFLLTGAPPDADDAPRDAEGRPLCARNVTFSVDGMSAVIGGATLAELADWLESHVDRPILDRTSLEGRFDAYLRFTPALPFLKRPIDPAAVDRNGPDVYRAVREQLGLALEPQRGPVPVLVVDSVERPSPD